MIGWDIFDFSSETLEQNLTKLDRKQDLNVLYQVCVFQVDSVNKNRCPGWSIKNVVQCTPMHNMLSFGPLAFIFEKLQDG